MTKNIPHYSFTRKKTQYALLFVLRSLFLNLLLCYVHTFYKRRNLAFTHSLPLKLTV